MTPHTDLIIEPEDLDPGTLPRDAVLIDVCKSGMYMQAHIPGARWLDYRHLVAGRKPVMGLVPDTASLSASLGKIGLESRHHVIAYDDEGGGRAGRLLWTLALLGHQKLSLLNGGLHAWVALNKPVTLLAPHFGKTHYPADVCAPELVADRPAILSRLQSSDTVVVDARSPAEYAGTKRLAIRGGHIPGAVNYNWTNAMDREQGLRLRDPAIIRDELASLGITPDRDVIVYCQTHHRSAFLFVLLKHLGFKRVSGYPGSWSDWGNTADSPIESETTAA